MYGPVAGNARAPTSAAGVRGGTAKANGRASLARNPASGVVRWKLNALDPTDASEADQPVVGHRQDRPGGPAVTERRIDRPGRFIDYPQRPAAVGHAARANGCVDTGSRHRQPLWRVRQGYRLDRT